MGKPVFRKALSRILGFIIFIAIAILLNVLVVFLPDPYLEKVVGFLNANLVLLFLMSAFFFFAEVFDCLDFPLNLPSPVFTAVGAIFIVTFIIRVMDLAGTLTGGIVNIDLKPIAFLLYLMAFLIALFAGFISIIIHSISGEKADDGHGASAPRRKSRQSRR